MADSPPAWRRVLPLEALSGDGGHYVELEGRGLAVFRDGDQVRVFDNACPHAGGALAGGYIEGKQVVCPWHFWCFDVEDGCFPENPRFRARVYPARCRNGWVEVQW